jgi:hypothetical protein
MKIVESRNQNGELVGYLVTSPGSEATVCFYKDKWSFNGDFEKATFRPSMLIHPNNMHGRDHFFVTDGKIEYLSDCEHALAGKTVDMVDVI